MGHTGPRSPSAKALRREQVWCWRRSRKPGAAGLSPVSGRERTLGCTGPAPRAGHEELASCQDGSCGRVLGREIIPSDLYF